MWSIPFGRNVKRFRSSRKNKRHSNLRSIRKSPTLEKLEDRYLLAGDILYQVNVGGESLLGDTVWQADTSSNPSEYTNASAANSKTYSNATSIDMGHLSIPVDTPEEVFQSERYDKTDADDMKWDFAVDPGMYEVRLYFAEIFDGAQFIGGREFDVSFEGEQVLDNYDVFADVGGFTGVVKSFVVTADSNLDIDFNHVTQNPALKAIEIVAIQ
ncbi:MAG: malectin [Pirellulales bacterium]|nr:malectin [Pirellulales bacterium]